MEWSETHPLSCGIIMCAVCSQYSNCDEFWKHLLFLFSPRADSSEFTFCCSVSVERPFFNSVIQIQIWQGGAQPGNQTRESGPFPIGLSTHAAIIYSSLFLSQCKESAGLWLRCCIFTDLSGCRRLKGFPHDGHMTVHRTRQIKVALL